MSSSSSTQSGHAPPLASSSRTPPSTSPEGDDYSEDGLDIHDAELLAEDPFQDTDVLDTRYEITKDR